VVRSHPEAHVHILQNNPGQTWILLGHAYDPWVGSNHELSLLEVLDSSYREGELDFLENLDRLSGRFVLFVIRGDDSGIAVQDAAGLKNLL
jgi:hypothetical protein